MQSHIKKIFVLFIVSKYMDKGAGYTSVRFEVLNE